MNKQSSYAKEFPEDDMMITPFKGGFETYNPFPTYQEEETKKQFGSEIKLIEQITGENASTQGT